MTNDTIVNRNEKLYIREITRDYFRPIEYTKYWPTGVVASQYPDFVGQPAIYENDGIYRLGNGAYIQLVARGETKAEVEEQPIAQPKRKGEYRYEQECWKRHTRMGWVFAG
mgnify:CR=1 FL=1